MGEGVRNQVNAIDGMDLIVDDVKGEDAKRSCFTQAGHEPSSISEEADKWRKGAN